MKQQNIKFLVALLISMLGVEAFAHDIAVANEDGKIIYYTYINNNTELAVSYRGSEFDSYNNEYSGNVVIPESVTYNEETYSVTSIGDYAFYECSSLTSITIPNSVTSIGRCAFLKCSALTSIFIPNSVISIGDVAFYGTAWYNKQPDGVVYVGKVAYRYKNTTLWVGDTDIVLKEGTLGIADYGFSSNGQLESITIPNSVTNIGSYAFQNCSGLENITIPNSVTNIGSYAFQYCSGLENITIPYSVTSIGEYAFEGCSSLMSLTIPNSVTSIGQSAFAYCSGLTSLTIPNSVTSIGSYAFDHCSDLKRITIGSAVTSIESDAFAGCSKLTDVYCLATNVPSTGDNVFQNSNINNAKLHVPKSAIESYHAMAPWSNFRMIASSDEVETNGTDVTTYLQNPGFDEDITWQADGSTKEIVDKSISLSERSFAWQAADNSVYASAKTSGNGNWKRTDVTYSWNGFIGHIQGWNVESNKMTQPPYNTNDKTPEWVCFGTVPYGLSPMAIPFSDNNNGLFLNVPDKPMVDMGDDNKGVLYLSAGWGARAVYKQVVSLPCAVYRLDYWVYNQNYLGSKYNTKLNNLCNVTCRMDVYTDDEAFNAQEWTLHSIEFTSTSEFTIQFGFESYGNSESNPYLFIDGVKLYKVGEADPLIILKSDFQNAAAMCDELIDDALAKNHEGLAGEISGYKSEIEEMAEGDNQAEMEVLLKEVIVRIDAFRQAIGEIDNVNVVLNMINNLLQNTNYVGKAALQAVYDKVNDYQKNTAGVKNLYALILEATAECDSAIKTYILTQEASEESPADFTLFIQHPWFIDSQAEPVLKNGVWEFPLRIDENGNDRYIKGSKNSPDLNSTGWYIAGASGGDQRVNWQCLRSCWNAWKSNYTTTMAIAQDIEGLPNGYYIVSADMITGNGNANGTQRVFAQSSIEKKTSTKAIESEGYDDAEWETVAMTTDDKVLVVDGKLTIGAEGTGDGNASAGWFMATNFHLYYLGPNPSDAKKMIIGASGVTTFCAAGDVDFTELNLKAYTGGGFNRQTGVLTMMRVYDVPAGTGLLVKGEPGTYYVPYSPSNSVYVNLLKGVTEATNVNATEGSYVNYVLNNGSQGVGFYKVGTAGASLEAGRAYLQIPAEIATSRNALKLRFDDEEESTAISDVERQEVNSAVYDLQGRRVEQPQRGLYIRNGKKVIVK